MASRRRSPDLQLGLSLPVRKEPGEGHHSAPLTPAAAPVDPVRSEKIDVEEFDDYSEDEPRLRLVDPPKPGPSVIVEVIDDHRFEVSRLRDNGTTVASVTWTRRELFELIERAQAALKLGGT